MSRKNRVIAVLLSVAVTLSLVLPALANGVVGGG